MKITDGKGARVVFDPVGGPTLPKLISAMSFQGILYIYGALSDEVTPLPVLDMIAKMPVIKGHNIWLTSGDPVRRKAAVDFILKGFESGALKPIIDRVSPSTRSSRRTATWKPTASSGRSSPRSELDGWPTEPDLKLKRKGSCRTGYDIMSFRIRSTDGATRSFTCESKSSRRVRRGRRWRSPIPEVKPRFGCYRSIGPCAPEEPVLGAWIDLERGKHSMPPARAYADLDPTAAQLIQSAEVLGQGLETSNDRYWPASREPQRSMTSRGYGPSTTVSIKLEDSWDTLAASTYAQPRDRPRPAVSRVC